MPGFLPNPLGPSWGHFNVVPGCDVFLCISAQRHSQVLGAHCPLCDDGNVGRITPQCVLQPRRDGSWWISIQLPPRLGTNPVVFYKSLPGSPSGMEPQFSHSGDLFIDTPLTGITSFLVLLLHALAVLPVMSPNKLTVPELLSPGLLGGPRGIQTEASGFGKEPSWDLEHPLCWLPPSNTNP